MTLPALKMIEDDLPVADSETCVLIDSDLPLYLGRHYLATHHRCKILRRFGCEWFIYNRKAYDVLPDEALRAAIYNHLDRLRKPNKDGKPCELRVNARMVSNVLDALPACETLVSGELPQWTDGRPGAADYLVLDNGLLHLPTRQKSPHDPTYFTTTALPYAYNPDAPVPNRWLSFLDSIWKDDQQSIDLLQEWFGYLLTGDTRYQKMLLMVGPKRSGKGTIARVMEAMIGAANCCSPTMGGLAQNFGMASIIGKRLAVFGDARISGRSDTAMVVDRLLSLSGGDLQTIPRKHKEDWIGMPETRIAILSNELPNLKDASGALTSRMLLLQLRESFYGRENHNLQDDLLCELPSILNWSLDGLERLRLRGRFPEVESSLEAMEQMTDLGSPVTAFVRECCEVKPGVVTPSAKLYGAWQDWCREQGMEHVTTKEVFGRDLKAAYPQCEKRQFRSGGGRERNYTNIRLL